MRGLRTGLVEQHDLAFGTSSRSSRLLHGGIRYLAQGRLGLVHEASREKRVLSADRPAPGRAPGLRLPHVPQDALAAMEAADRRQDVRLPLRRAQLRAVQRRWIATEPCAYLPGLNAENLTGAVRYYDGLTNDSRLVLDTLRSAAAHGAIISNYTRLEEASPHGDPWRCRVWRRALRPRATKSARRAIVNATGPWAPSLPQARIRLRLTKGVHLVIDRERLPVPDAVVMPDGRRILFAIPWGRRVILGTTDTDYRRPAGSGPHRAGRRRVHPRGRQPLLPVGGAQARRTCGPRGPDCGR